MKKQNSALPWILTALLLVAVLLVTAVGFSKLSNLNYARVWQGEAGEVSLRALTEEELGEDRDLEREYYMLEFPYTNLSRDELDNDMFRACPKDGKDWAVQPLNSEGRPNFPLRPNVPAGCTGMVQLAVRVDRAEMKGDTIKIMIDPYGTFPRTVAEVTLP